MKTYENYLMLRDQRYLAENWINHENLIDSQDGKNYELTQVKFSAKYCGQSYSGANNYHEAPKDFSEAMAKVIKDSHKELFRQAFQIMKDKEQIALIACEEEVKKILSEINLAKGDA